MLDVHRLARSERHGFLKILRHLVLRAVGRNGALLRREKDYSEQQSCHCGSTPCSFAKIQPGLIHYFLASKTSSSVFCFSWYIASNWYRSCAFDGFNPACARKSSIALSSKSSFSW